MIKKMPLLMIIFLLVLGCCLMSDAKAESTKAGEYVSTPNGSIYKLEITQLTTSLPELRDLAGNDKVYAEILSAECKSIRPAIYIDESDYEVVSPGQYYLIEDGMWALYDNTNFTISKYVKIDEESFPEGEKCQAVDAVIVNGELLLLTVDGEDILNNNLSVGLYITLFNDAKWDYYFDSSYVGSYSSRLIDTPYLGQLHVAFDDIYLPDYVAVLSSSADKTQCSVVKGNDVRSASSADCRAVVMSYLEKHSIENTPIINIETYKFKLGERCAAIIAAKFNESDWEYAKECEYTHISEEDFEKDNPRLGFYNFIILVPDIDHMEENRVLLEDFHKNHMGIEKRYDIELIHIGDVDRDGKPEIVYKERHYESEVYKIVEI